MARHGAAAGSAKHFAGGGVGQRAWTLFVTLVVGACLPGSASSAAEYWQLRPPIPTIEAPQDYRFYTLSKAPVAEIKLGKLTIRFEETVIQDVAKTIGAGRTRSKPGGSWLCYRWNDQRSTHQLWLETATLSEKVGRVIVKAEPPPAEATCPELPAQFRDVQVLGLHLNLSLGDVSKAMPRAIPGIGYVGDKDKFAFIYRGCDSNGIGGVGREGSLFIEWKYPDPDIYQLVAHTDTNECY
jgi:hypothetical protein